MEAPSRNRRVRFGVFEVDLQAGELRKSGVKVKLQEQPFQILSLLLERPGEVVTREELGKKLWPADTFVDFDVGLNTSIKKLREALGDSAENPCFVETLPRRGYRFIASIDNAAPVGGHTSPLVNPALGTAEPPALASPPAKAPAPSWVGHVATLCSDSNLPFVLVPVDEETIEERERLEAANDDVGLSLLIAPQRLLLVPTGTKVRVLEARPPQFGCQVRILEGEHYGKTALVPRKYLAGLS